MPEPIELGPLDPAFAAFREKKIVEKLTEVVNAPAPPPEDAPAPAPVDDDEAPFKLPSKDQIAKLAALDPEYAKFLEKKANESEAKSVEKDDSRLVFGAAPKAADEGGLGAAAVAAKPAESLADKVAGTVIEKTKDALLEKEGDDLFDKAVAKAAEKTSEKSGEAWGAIARAKPPSAPTPKKPEAVAPKPAPKPAPVAAAPKPTAPPPAARPAQPSRPAPTPRFTSDESPYTMPAVSLPERPTKPSSDEDLAGQLAQVRQRLATLLGESGQRLLELKVASSEGIDRSIASFEAEAKRVREYLERNAALASEAEGAAHEVTKQAEEQDRLEGTVVQVHDGAMKLKERVAALRAALVTLDEESSRLEVLVDDRARAIEQARSENDRLSERLTNLLDDAQTTGTLRDRLAENTDRLEKIRDEHAAAIERLKTMKDSLTKPVA